MAARTPKDRANLNRYINKSTLIDQETRHRSTYIIIQQLLKSKPILKGMTNPSATIRYIERKQVKELESIFKKLHLVIIEFQSADLIPLKNCREWKIVIFKLVEL